MSLPTTSLYNQPEYSDVTIQFSGREVHCHKLVLCTNSEYFAKLCGPGSHFAEGKQGMIELKEDDPDAVEDMLNYVYTKRDNLGRDDDWHHQYQVAQAAEKYLLPDLARLALEKYLKHVKQVSDPQQVFETIMHIRQHPNPQEVLLLADDLEKKYILKLMKVEDFRGLISEDPVLMWRYLDDFNREMSNQQANIENLQKISDERHQKMTEQQKIITERTESVSRLRRKIDKLEEKVDEQEAVLSGRQGGLIMKCSQCGERRFWFDGSTVTRCSASILGSSETCTGPRFPCWIPMDGFENVRKVLLS